MKIFLKRTFALLLIVVLGFLGLNYGYYLAKGQEHVVAFEVYYALEMAEQKTQYRTVVLGDSVARQLFHPDRQMEEDEVCYLATNQAIMPLGNSILLERFLENNPQAEKVCYAARPGSLLGEIGFTYTYSYFVTPFYQEAYFPYMEAETKQGMEAVFGRLFARSEFVKWVIAKYPKLLQIYLDGCQSRWQQKVRLTSAQLPDTALVYLKKIQEMCEEYDIEFQLVPVPMSKESGFHGDEWKAAFEKAGLGELAEQYLSRMEFAEEEQFRDGIHMKDDFLEKNRDWLQQRVLGQE